MHVFDNLKVADETGRFIVRFYYDEVTGISVFYTDEHAHVMSLNATCQSDIHTHTRFSLLCNKGLLTHLLTYLQMCYTMHPNESVFSSKVLQSGAEITKDHKINQSEDSFYLTEAVSTREPQLFFSV